MALVGDVRHPNRLALPALLDVSFAVTHLLPGVDLAELIEAFQGGLERGAKSNRVAKLRRFHLADLELRAV